VAFSDPGHFTNFIRQFWAVRSMMLTTHERRAGLDRRVFLDPVYNGPERRGQQNRRSGTQRRKHKRYQVKDFTFVKLWSESDEDLGQLLDISSGGLALRYFASAGKPKNFNELGIFLSGDEFSIARIPFRTVSDTELADGLQFGSIDFRRSGLQFGHLTPDQRLKLDYFLDNYTLGKA